MVSINDNYFKLKVGYLFFEIVWWVNVFIIVNFNVQVIKFGIGDVMEFLFFVCCQVMVKVIDDMGDC